MEECTEVVSYLKNDTIYKNAGAEIPRGILLEGPPGSGKTLLAKAIASEADANFISVSGSEFVELFVGAGAAKVRNLFRSARANKPCIIFIDEIDAVGKKRGISTMQSNDEREQTLNQLLSEMDGFVDNEGILIIAATNRKDILDPALLRPGRFDRIVNVPLPDRYSRIDIFNVHSKNKRIDPTININLVADLTAGFSGAEIKNLLNEAAIYTARRGMQIIEEADLLNALDKLLIGIVKRNDTRSEESKIRIAVHELGHALLAVRFKEYFDFKKVTIQNTYNGVGGFTVFNEYANITESGLYTKDLFFKRLVVMLGGKAAENIYYGENFVSLGAREDLKQSNMLANQMVSMFGMGDDLEVFFNDPSIQMRISNDMLSLIDKESLGLVLDAYEDAKDWLISNRHIMDELIPVLIENRTLYMNDLNTLLPYL
jgi:cell division protease FtsH